MSPNRINRHYRASLIFSGILSLGCFAVNGQSLRDPTLPAKVGHTAQALQAESDLVLHSIVKGEHSYVVINDKILKLGERIQGLSIINISHRDVTLSDGRKLTLFQSITE